MKALLLVGGQGTRLRPLTIHAPKSIVPIFNRPFLHYQLDLIKQVPEIDEVILSLNYQPQRIEEIFGDGRDSGIRIRYVVEPTPLGTAGAVRYAAEGLTETLVVFNGDVLTQVDLAGLIAFHRDRQARATIVLTPVDNPTAYGLVETDRARNVRRFLEKPKLEDVTCNTINAGIYVLEPETLSRIPKGVAWSIERSFFPSFIEQGETFVASIYDDYWIDIGTPEKYMQVHRDIMDGRYAAPPFDGHAGVAFVAPTAKVAEGARLEAPLFIDEGCVVQTGSRIGPYSVLGKNCEIGEDVVLSGAILWSGAHIGREAQVRDAIIGRHANIGRNAAIGRGVFGDNTQIAEYSRI
jgi:NDP-sugar pyrophosphorylase family protein